MRSDRKVKDAKMRAAINQQLVETGEKERLVPEKVENVYTPSCVVLRVADKGTEPCNRLVLMR